MPLGVLPRTMSPSMNNFWASCAADILATDMFANPTTIKDNAITGNFRVSISGASLSSSWCVAAFEHPGVICLIAWTATTSVRAACGVLTTLAVADLTNGTGRFNPAQGLVGTLSGVGASLSTSMTGIVAQNFGYTAGPLSVTAVGFLSVAVALAFMPETKPSTPPKGLGTPPQGLGVPLSPRTMPKGQSGTSMRRPMQ